jgi:hypothetical protein
VGAASCREVSSARYRPDAVWLQRCSGPRTVGPPQARSSEEVPAALPRCLLARSASPSLPDARDVHGPICMQRQGRATQRFRWRATVTLPSAPPTFSSATPTFSFAGPVRLSVVPSDFAVSGQVAPQLPRPAPSYNQLPQPCDVHRLRFIRGPIALCCLLLHLGPAACGRPEAKDPVRPIFTELRLMTAFHYCLGVVVGASKVD